MEQVEAPAPRRMSKRPIAVVTRDLRYLRENGPGCVYCREHDLKCTGERPQCTACVSIDRHASMTNQLRQHRQRKRAAAARHLVTFAGMISVASVTASVPRVRAVSNEENLVLLPRLPSEGEESDVVMPSRPHTPDVLPTESPTTPLDPNRPRYPQGNGLGQAGSTRNPDGTNCTRPVACFFCIKVELPCTGDFPTCVNCVRRNLQCAYPEPASYAHQFPRQSAMHTRQKDATPHRGGTSNTHPSPTRGQPTIHPSRSPRPAQPNGAYASSNQRERQCKPESRHNRQRSMSGPNGLPAGFDRLYQQRLLLDHPPLRILIPVIHPFRSLSRPINPHKSNPTPDTVPRSTAQSPPGLSPPQPKTWTPSTPQAQPLQHPGGGVAKMKHRVNSTEPLRSCSSPLNHEIIPCHGLRIRPPTTERVIGDVRAPPGMLLHP
ncbi:Fungal Zn(2)-Cys(6) binuclear cluster domain [Ceratobasidium sp. AG-Ba]|nr:Fungal Zn(2)-Cys(6) binuclear cluster domain [Ceratobasidium sp. AG-Ba]